MASTITKKELPVSASVSTDDLVFVSPFRNRLAAFLEKQRNLFLFVEKSIGDTEFILPQTELLNTCEPPKIIRSRDYSLRFVLNAHRINDFRRLNEYFREIHRNLETGGFFVGISETITVHKRRFFTRYPGLFGSVFYGLEFFYKRVMPKVKWLSKIYFMISKGRNRVFSKAEILGRLYYCGFKVLAISEHEEGLYFFAKKEGIPFTEAPACGPLIKLKRIGARGEIIYINKFRTMHPYSQFLQEYIYYSNSLNSNGKFNQDFRVTEWGAFLRKYWLDELPQLVNWLKGDVKLVGVRALSEQYFKLYPEQLRKMRLAAKPGLIPPFYVDLPNSFEDILASERRYIQRCKASPWLTDLQYFSRAISNIFFKNARSA